MAGRILTPGEFFEPGSLGQTLSQAQDVKSKRLSTGLETARQEGVRRAYGGEGGTLADAATVRAKQERLKGDIGVLGKVSDAASQYFTESGDLEGANEIHAGLWQESPELQRILPSGPMKILGKEGGLTYKQGSLAIEFTDPETGQQYPKDTNLTFVVDNKGNIVKALPFGAEEPAGRGGAARVKSFGVEIDSQIERILSSPQYSHDEQGNVLTTLDEKMAFLNRLATKGQFIEDEQGEERIIQNLQAQDDMQAINGLIQTGERLLQSEVGGAFVGSGGDQLRATPRAERPSILDQPRVQAGREVQPSLASTPEGRPGANYRRYLR